MKESYKRSKVALKPLNSSDFKSKSSVIDYDEYEERLNNFENDKQPPQITDLFDWSKPSEVIALRNSQRRLEPQPEVMVNNSMNTEQLLRSESDEGERQLQQDIELDDSIEIESPVRSNYSQHQNYMERISHDYGSEYRLMSVIKLESELKEMRERIIQMNMTLNKMLDKYELLGSKNTKKEPIITNPHKFYSQQIELNSRIIQKQHAHIQQLQEKDRQLQKKDYLVELTELIVEMRKQIHDLQKQKHDKKVNLQKINKFLKETESIQQNGDQYREVKQLKHLLVFYAKKIKEQQTTQQQLEKDYKILAEKEAAVNTKLQSLAKLAEQKYLQVSTNQYYVDLKKDYEQFIALAEASRKKREIMLRSQKGAEEKLQKQIQQLKRDIQKAELDTQEAEYRAQGIEEDTKQFMTKNHVVNRELRSISYRFDQSLIHHEKGSFKPNFRRRAATKMEGKINKTIDAPANEGPFFTSINDKNTLPHDATQSIQNSQSNSSSVNSRLKPILRSWKGKPSNARYLGSPQKLSTIESSNIFKPPLLSKTRKR